MQGGCSTDSLPRTDIPSASVAAALATSAKPEAVRRQAGLSAFWSCYTLGFFIRLPLVLWAGIKAAVQRTSVFARTYHNRLDLLNGKLTILFLNGMLPNTVPLLFGELFTTVLYDGIAIDPGSPKMRSSLARHLRQMKTENHEKSSLPTPMKNTSATSIGCPTLLVLPFMFPR